MELFFAVLSFGFQSVPFLVAIVMGLFLPYLIAKLCGSVRLGTIFVLVVSLLTTWWMGDRSVQLGIQVYLTDVVLGLVCVATVFRLLLVRDSPNIPVAWWFFCACVFASTILGIFKFGTAAGVQARPYFYFVVAATYLMTFRFEKEQVKMLLNSFLISALVLMLIAVFRWIVYYVPVASLLPPGGVFNVDGAVRVIYSGETLLLAFVASLAAFFSSVTNSYRRLSFLAPVIFLFVLVLQHRSVWLAAIAGVMISLMLIKGGSRSAGSMRFLWFGASVVLLAMALVVGPLSKGVAESVSSSASRALSGEGSVAARLDGWKGMLDKWYQGGALVIVTGHPFGADNTRYGVDRQRQIRKTTFQAHNMYVQTLFNTGLVGVISFVVFLASLASGLWALCKSKEGDETAAAFLVLTAMLCVYFVAYGLSYAHALVLGGAVAYLNSRGRDPA